MPSPFSKTLRSIEGDSGRFSAVFAYLFVIFGAAWVAWFLFVDLEIQLDSETARIESDQKAHVVEAPVQGRILTVDVDLGQSLNAGDVLVRLETDEITFLMSEQEARARFAELEVEALEKQIAAEERALNRGDDVIGAVVQEGSASQREKSAVAQIAEIESSYTDSLVEDGHVSQLRQERDRITAEQSRAALQAAAAASAREEAAEVISLIDRESRIADLRRELAISRGEAARARIAAARYQHQLSEHMIRTPVAGVVGELGHLRPRTVVSRDERIATVIPASSLHVVAYFDPEKSLGRIKPGSQGVFRAEAYPWTQYGSLSVMVTSVASEVTDELIRVELAVVEPANGEIPLQHGMPGVAKIRIDQASPATIVLRLIGKYVG